MVDAIKFGRRPEFISNGLDEEEQARLLLLCPGVNLKRERAEPEADCNQDYYDEWGPIFTVYEGHATDREIRFKGSSGGVITALSLFCLEQAGCNNVLHVKADVDKPWLNTTVMSCNRGDLLGGVGSRYSPASPCEKLSYVEKADGKSVVVGKPCDIAATYNLARDRTLLQEKIGVLIACFCAGTPSTEGTLQMLEKMCIAKDDLQELRYRGYGWPGKTTAIDKKEADNKRELAYSQSWGGILQKFRPWRCYICPDHAGEFADIAVGDPWYKEVIKDDIGQSLILARTRRGVEIIEQAIASGYIEAVPVEPKFLPESQVNLQFARANLWGRLLTLKLMNAPYPMYKNFKLFHPWLNRLSCKEKIKTILGTLKRVFVKNLKKKQTVYNSVN
ncbi:MAG: coenzyme F420 hydrogenase [Desulfobacterales bacterium]|nr:MAG: coenzyme F420 hydrogenase [Desulfobacterales bacterium]